MHTRGLHSRKVRRTIGFWGEYIDYFLWPRHTLKKVYNVNVNERPVRCVQRWVCKLLIAASCQTRVSEHLKRLPQNYIWFALYTQHWSLCHNILRALHFLCHYDPGRDHNTLSKVRYTYLSSYWFQLFFNQLILNHMLRVFFLLVVQLNAFILCLIYCVSVNSIYLNKIVHFCTCSCNV